ncbi:unnamed protein product [Lampetra planeri]
MRRALLVPHHHHPTRLDCAGPAVHVRAAPESGRGAPRLRSPPGLLALLPRGVEFLVDSPRRGVGLSGAESVGQRSRRRLENGARSFPPERALSAPRDSTRLHETTHQLLAYRSDESASISKHARCADCKKTVEGRIKLEVRTAVPVPYATLWKPPDLGCLDSLRTAPLYGAAGATRVLSGDCHRQRGRHRLRSDGRLPPPPPSPPNVAGCHHHFLQ